MTTPPHARLVARFELGPSGGPVETASCKLAFQGAQFAELGFGEFSQGEMSDMAEHGFECWNRYIDSSTTFLTGVALVEVRSYIINTDGRAVGKIGTSGPRPAVRGSVTASCHPWQISKVVTLIGENRGPGRYGRFYPPPEGIPVSASDGLMSTTDRDFHLGKAKAFLEDISDYPGLDLGWSLVNISTKGTGTMNKVSAVKVGCVLDTQRRRRRSLEEKYATAALST